MTNMKFNLVFGTFVATNGINDLIDYLTMSSGILSVGLIGLFVGLAFLTFGLRAKAYPLPHRDARGRFTKGTKNAPTI